MTERMHKRLSRRQFAQSSLAAVCGGAAALAGSGAGRAAWAQGVTRLPSAKHVPWLAEVQAPPARLPPDAPRLGSLVATSEGGRIANTTDWNARAEQLRTAWLKGLGMWSPPAAAPQYEIIESERTAKVTRRLVTYETEPQVRVDAYLLTPNRIRGRLPGVVVFHSTVDYTIRQPAGLEGPPQMHWGLRLAEQGMVVLCPRCFLWNGTPPANYQARVAEHAARHPMARGMAKMLHDAQRAVDVLASVEEVDPSRIGAAGHSLGAKEVLDLAAFDPRVRAAVSSEGGIGTTFSNWDAPWYLGTKQFGREHHELLGLAAPRAFLLIGGDSADGARSWPFIERTLDVYHLYSRAARIGLYNHGQGHTVPPLAEQRVYEWLATYL